MLLSFNIVQNSLFMRGRFINRQFRELLRKIRNHFGAHRVLRGEMPRVDEVDPLPRCVQELARAPIRGDATR